MVRAAMVGSPLSEANGRAQDFLVAYVPINIKRCLLAPTAINCGLGLGPHIVAVRRDYVRFFRDFFNRTPGPPPLSSMNSIPAVSSALCSFPRASPDTRGPNPASTRFTVGRESPARDASSV